MSCHVDTATQTIVCDKCLEETPMPLGDVRWVSGVLKAFARAHRDCRRSELGRHPLCYFVTNEPKQKCST